MTHQILKVANLAKSYGKKKILSDVSFHVNEAEIVGILGSNGSGKTTTFHIVIGLSAQDLGDIVLNGHCINRRKIHERARLGLSYLAQEPSIFLDLTTEQNILCILELLNFSKSTQQQLLREHLQALNLTHLAKKKAAKLSGGERRRLEITRSLICRPKIVLLDEPFANIDPLSIDDVKKLMRHLKSLGISILITDHNAREILSIVDRCYLLDRGRTIFEGTAKQLLADVEARRIYLGDAFTL